MFHSSKMQFGYQTYTS
jgi:peroxiredoxin 5